MTEFYNEEDFTFTPNTYEDFEQQFDDIIRRDDKDKLVSTIIGLVDYSDYFELGTDIIPHDIVAYMTLRNAINCAAALLQGVAGLRVDLNAPFPWGTFPFPLHIAAEQFSVTLIQLYLHHGARTDVRTNIDDDFIYNALLPLNVALEQLCYHDYLKDWTPKDSIFKLIIILCLPQMKVPLEATRLLALHTKETTEEFFLYAKHGCPLQMAVLLMVARHIFLAPIRSQGGLTLNGIMSIRRRIKKQISALIQDEVDLAGKGKNSTLVKQFKEKRAALFSALTLLDVFEKAGDAIDTYLRLDPTHKLSKDKVVEDVKSILVKAGFDLRKRDIDLTNIKWDTYDGWICDSQLASGKSEITTEKNSQPLGQYLPLQQDGLMGKQSICHVHEQKWAFESFINWTPTFSRKSNLARAFSTFPKLNARFTNPKDLETQVKKRTKPRQQFLRNLPKSKHYATLAYSLAKATKRV